MPPTKQLLHHRCQTLVRNLSTDPAQQGTCHCHAAMGVGLKIRQRVRRRNARLIQPFLTQPQASGNRDYRYIGYRCGLSHPNRRLAGQ